MDERENGRTNTAEDLQTITTPVDWGRRSNLLGRCMDVGTPGMHCSQLPSIQIVVQQQVCFP